MNFVEHLLLILGSGYDFLQYFGLYFVEPNTYYLFLIVSFQLHLELHRIKASADSTTVTSPNSQINCSACKLTFKTSEELQEHLEVGTLI